MASSIKTIDSLLLEAIDDVRTASNSRKKTEFTLNDAVKFKHHSSKRTQTIIKAFEFLNSNPLKNNDYFKYFNAYANHGIELNTDYFKHDIDKLKEYYKKYDDSQINPFNIQKYREYVVYISLKLFGCYVRETDDLIFNVKVQDNREYNPLTNIPSVLRGELHFQVKEYDIKKAFPTFIDIELNTNHRSNVYDLISKKEFATALNSHHHSKVSIEDARSKLKTVYSNRVNEVLTEKRFNERGRAFLDFVRYESEYIKRFVKSNKIDNFARLHDGVFVLEDTIAEQLTFDKVEFALKECIKPKVINDNILFYDIDENGKVILSPSKISEFLIQENFVRITTSDDKIQLLKNSNNVIDYFCHKTNIVSFLESKIIEADKSKVKDAIARHNYSTIAQSYNLIKPTKLKYYRDSKDSFGLPFKNGFMYFDNLNTLEIKKKSYNDVDGFFTPHQIQEKEFVYTDEIGDFETFIYRASTGLKEYDNSIKEFQSISSMIGYSVTTYKKPSDNPILVFTDEGANEETRNGRRGKSLLTLALGEVTNKITKGNKEFAGNYLHNYAELNESINLYIIDDAPAGFNYNDLYTSSTGAINVQPKGSKAFEIDFKDTPKFIVTSNFIFRLNKDDASSVARFTEFKFKPYYSNDYKPEMEFGKLFFNDWNNTEWNKFYSFIFRCVFDYLKNGIIRMEYDKAIDNYNAEFSEGLEKIMFEILDVLTANRKPFSVSDVVDYYQTEYYRSARLDNLIHKNNAKRLIKLFIEANDKYQHYRYGRGRKWECNN